MFALLDGNAFYCSCEQVFDPSLRNKPLIVASNNDGCAIARTTEAKKLGVKMGHPLHELKGLVKQGLLMRSANFTLYGDMHSRVNSILRDSVRRTEVYSIDETFLDLSPHRNRAQFARSLSAQVKRWTGIPNCVGIGPTKTLAKAANKMAKSGEGVVDLSDERERKKRLDAFPLDDVWGVGPRWFAKLQALGFHTAGQLRDAPDGLLLEKFGVVLARTQRELQGIPCLALEEVEPDRQQIMVSRSFGERVESHERVHEAIATFAVRAAEKLRKRGLVASGVWVFAHSDSFRPELRQHHPSRSTSLPTATSDTQYLLHVVSLLVRGMLKDGVQYKKAGVALLDLARPTDVQGDLFQPAVVGNTKLMTVLDAVNRRYGSGTMGLAATGWQKRPDWGMRQTMKSPRYTTRIEDIPRVEC